LGKEEEVVKEEEVLQEILQEVGLGHDWAVESEVSV
jgi:hypothetical protein